MLSTGPIRASALLEYAVNDPAQQKGMLDYLATRDPLGRIGDPKEIAKAALFLASNDSSFVNALNCSLTAIKRRSDTKQNPLRAID